MVLRFLIHDAMAYIHIAYATVGKPSALINTKMTKFAIGDYFLYIDVSAHSALNLYQNEWMGGVDTHNLAMD